MLPRERALELYRQMGGSKVGSGDVARDIAELIFRGQAVTVVFLLTLLFPPPRTIAVVVPFRKRFRQPRSWKEQ